MHPCEGLLSLRTVIDAAKSKILFHRVMKGGKYMEKSRGANVKSISLLFGIFVLAGSLIMLPLVEAKDWPTKPITVVVGMPPGGMASTTARVVVNEMSKILGVPIIVIDVGGGGGGIGAEKVFRAPNDGYTWYAQGTALESLGVMGFH